MRLTSSFARLKHSTSRRGREREKERRNFGLGDILGLYWSLHTQCQFTDSSVEKVSNNHLIAVSYQLRKHFVEINNQVKYMENRFRIV